MGISRFTCEEVFGRLDDYLDRELSGEEMSIVQDHLETCALCASEYRFELTVIAQVRERLRRIEVPASLAARISQKLARAEGD